MKRLSTLCGDTARGLFLRILRDEGESTKMRAAAARYLGRTGECALDILEAQIDSDLPRSVRAGAVLGLAELGTGGAARRALELARARGSRLRQAGLEALRGMSENGAVPALLAAVQDPALAEDVRAAACRGLAASRPDSAVQPLMRLLGDKCVPDSVRSEAARTLGVIGRIEALDCVRSACHGEPRRVARQARIAYSRLSHVTE